MAFTKVVGAGIHTLSNIASHNINSSGIITATKFVGPFDGTNGDFSGNVSIGGSLTVNGDFTTLNTTLREVEILHVDANSSEPAGIITQRGSGDILNLFDGTTEVLTVKDGGFVGVGTTNPTSKLTIAEDGASTNAELAINYAGSGNRTSAIRFQKSGTNFAFIAGANFMLTTGAADDLGIAPLSGKNLLFGIGSSEKLRITSTGSVGIGTTDPLQRLHVKQGSTTTPAMVEALGAKSHVKFQHNAGNSYTATIGSKTLGANNVGLTFDTGYNGAEQRMTIDVGGKVGIGTNLPGSLLHVSTNTGGTTDLLTLHADADGTNDGVASIKFVGNTGNHAAFIKGGHTTNGDTVLTFHTDAHASGINPEERLRIDSDGRILIGRTSAYANVDADNLIVGNETVNEHQGITILSHTGKYGSIYFGDGHGTGGAQRGQIIYDHPNDQLRMGAGGNAGTHFYINSSGYIGINQSPSARLDVKQDNAIAYNGRAQSISYGAARFLNESAHQSGGTYTGFQFNITGDSQNRICAIGMISEASNTRNSSLVFATDDGTNRTEKLRITSGGKIGVGITNPTEKFEVKSGNIAIVGGSGYKIDTHPLLTTASFTDITGGTYAARLGSTGSSTIRSTQIYGGGNHIATFDGVNYRLGIRETAPDASLHITGGLPHIRLENSGTNANTGDIFGQIDFKHNDSTDPGVTSAIKCVAEDANGKSFLGFYNGNGGNADERFRINSNGTVHTTMTGTAPTWLGNTMACREKFSVFQGGDFAEACFNIDVDNANSFLSHNMYYSSGSWRIKKSGQPVRHLEIGTNGWTFMTGADGSDNTASALTNKFRIRPSGRIQIANNNEDIDMASDSPGQIQIDGNGYTGAIALNSQGMFLYHNSSSRYIGIGINETEVGRFTGGGYEQRFSNTTTYSTTSGNRKGIYVFNDGETNGCYASLELAATDSNDYFGSTILNSIATGDSNYSNDFAIQTRNNGNYGERFRITANGKVYLNGNSAHELAPVHHGGVSCNSEDWYKFATVTGNQLSSEIYMTAHDTLNSVVITASFHIKCAHYQDIYVESRSMAYSEVKLKVVSNNNQNFDLYMRRTSGSTMSTIETSIFPLNKETIEYNTTVNYTGQSHEHTTAAGTMKITGAGGVQANINVAGSITGSSKNFSIEHPLTSLASTKKLVHASIEGPQLDLIYRGKVDLVGGSASVNIDTAAGMSEGTFVLMNSNVQCFTTNETGWSAIKGSVSGNVLTITAQDNSSTDTISWMVVGERQDDVIKSSNVTDDSGKLIVEPLVFEEPDNSSKAEYYPTS